MTPSGVDAPRVPLSGHLRVHGCLKRYQLRKLGKWLAFENSVRRIVQLRTAERYRRKASSAPFFTTTRILVLSPGY